MSCSMKYAQMVPNAPTGAETRKIRCQLIGASTPPSMSPMNDPAMAAITQAAMANPKATPRPSWNGAVIRCGKNSRPTT